MRRNDDPWIESFRQTAAGWLLGESPPDPIPRAVFLPMENPDVYDAGWIAGHAADLETCGTLTLGLVNGRRIAFSSPKFGAPAVAMAVDVFAKAGFRSVVGVGFCGGLQSDVQCGELILPCSAVREEGASRHYAEEERPAECSERAAIVARECAERLGIALRTGPVWTTDGILRETREKVERYHSFGCLGVDMETAALYTVASVTNLRAAAILVASDNVYECMQADLDRLREGWRSAAALGVALSRELAEEEATED